MSSHEKDQVPPTAICFSRHLLREIVHSMSAVLQYFIVELGRVEWRSAVVRFHIWSLLNVITTKTKCLFWLKQSFFNQTSAESDQKSASFLHQLLNVNELKGVVKCLILQTCSWTDKAVTELYPGRNGSNYICQSKWVEYKHTFYFTCSFQESQWCRETLSAVCEAKFDPE